MGVAWVPGRLEAASVLASCFGVCLALGSCFSIGNLTTYVTSYLRLAGGAVTYADTMWLDSVLRVTMGPLYALGGVLHNRFGPRLAVTFGGTLLLLGTCLSTLAVQGSLAALIATYSLLQGAGIGVSLASVSLTCVEWFPRRRGLALGINMGGFALGPVVFNWVQTLYVNADDVAPGADGYFTQPEMLRNVPSLFLLQGTVQAGLLLPALFLLRPPPPPPEPATDLPEKSPTGELPPPAEEPPRSVSVPEALRSRRFYQLLAGYVPTMVAFEFFQVAWKTFGQTFIADDRFLTTVGSVAPLFALLGNLAWGQLGDATSFRSALVMAHGSMSMLFATLAAARHAGAAGYCAWVWALSASCSALFACQLPLMQAEFGPAHAGVLLGLLNMVRAVFTPVTPLLARLLLRRAHGYQILFLVQAAFACLAMCSLISATPARELEARRREKEAKKKAEAASAA